MEEEEYKMMLNHLQQYVPHLEKLISQLKDPKKKNRELQLSKIEGLHSMITDRKKKLKLDTLKKCEDVILKILQKVHPTVYKQFEHPDTSSNSTRLSAARARLNEISTPASPSPPRDVPTMPPPIVIPTEKVPLRAIEHVKMWERREDRVRVGGSRTDTYKTEKPDVYRRAAESLSANIAKPTVFDRLGAKVDMSVPPLSLEDLQKLTEPDNLTVGELENLRVVLKNKIVHEDKKAFDSKSRHENKIKEIDHKPKPRVEKVYKNPDTQFGNFLSKIDEQILEKKDDKRPKQDTFKKEKKNYKDKKKEEDRKSFLSEKVNNNEKPMFRRLADKYNPKPRKNSIDFVERPAIVHPQPSSLDRSCSQEIDTYQNINTVEPDTFHNQVDESWKSNYLPQHQNRDYVPPHQNITSRGGNTYMNTFIVQNNMSNQYPTQNNFHNQIPPTPKVFHPYEPIAANEYDLSKMQPVEYYQPNYPKQRPFPTRVYPPTYSVRERPQYSEQWPQDPRNAPRRDESRAVNKDPRIRAREQKESREKAFSSPGPACQQVKKVIIEEQFNFRQNKYDSMYSNIYKVKTKEETFVSPLDSLYGMGEDVVQKTGKGYGVQKFRIPKKKLEIEEILTPIEESEVVVEEVEEIDNEPPPEIENLELIVVEEQEPETKPEPEEKKEKVEEKKEKVEEKKVEVEEEEAKVEEEEKEKVEETKEEEKIVAKASPSENMAISDFLTNLIHCSDKTNIINAIVSSLTGGVSGQQARKFKRIQKIIYDSDSEDEVKIKTNEEVKVSEPQSADEDVEEDDEEEATLVEENDEEEKDVIKKSGSSKRNKRKSKGKSALQKQTQKKKGSKQKIDEDLDSVVETVGERIKSRRRNVNSNDPPRARKSTELDKLHKDIKEMFICDGVLTATGKRMCRILKSDVSQEESVTQKVLKCPEERPDSPRRRASQKLPQVIIEKVDISKLALAKGESESIKTRSKANRKRTIDLDSGSESSLCKTPPKRTSNQRVKTKPNYTEIEDDTPSPLPPSPKSVDDKDEIDSPIDVGEKKIKKKKRGHSWASGIITKKISKKKPPSPAPTPTPTPTTTPVPTEELEAAIEDETPENTLEEKVENVVLNDAIEKSEHDKEYFFDPQGKNECRICSFKGKFIVQHYRSVHPTHEVLISRVSPENALKAIDESIENNYEEVVAADLWETKIRRKRFNFKCRFCQVFFKNDTAESFFDHLTSHTGEYRFSCVLCSFKTANVRSLRAHLHSSHQTNCEQVGTVKPVHAAPPNFSMVFGYICTECHFIQLHQQSIEKHFKNHHSGECKVNKINLSSVTSLMNLEENDDEKSVIDAKDAPTHKEEAKLEINPTDVITPDEKETTKTDIIEEVEKIKISKEDPTIFKSISISAEEGNELEGQKHEMMQEINENVSPKKKLSHNLLDKIKDRLNDKEEDVCQKEKKEENKNPPTLELTTTSDIKKPTDVTAVIEEVQQTVPSVTTAVAAVPVEKTFLVKKSVLVNKIVERLQDKLNIDHPPPLIPLPQLEPIVPITSEIVQVQVGPIVAKKTNDHFLYICCMQSCIFSSTVVSDFRTHCKIVHSNKQWDGVCNICNIDTKLIQIEDAFEHLLSIHKKDLDEDENENEKKYPLLEDGEISSDTQALSDDHPIICTSEYPFKIVNVETVMEQPDFPFQIANVTTLTSDDDQPNTCVPPLSIITSSPTNTSLSLQSHTVSLMMPVLSPITVTVSQSIPSPSKTVSNTSASGSQSSSNSNKIILKDVPLLPSELEIPRKSLLATNHLLKEQKLVHLYKCPERDCIFSSHAKKMFELHIRQHPEFIPGVQKPCLYCNFKVDYSFYLMHVEIRHARSQFCCAYCFYRAINQSYVEMHQEQTHPNKPRRVLVSSVCLDIGKQIQLSMPPLQTVVPLYICAQLGCDKKFIFENDFALHSNMHLGPLSCFYCLYVPTNGNDAVIHMQKHNVYKYHCRMCVYGGNTPDDIFHHLAKHHFTYASQLIVRLYVPDPENKYKKSIDYNPDDPKSFERLHFIKTECSKYLSPRALIETRHLQSNKKSDIYIKEKKETITLYKAPMASFTKSILKPTSKPEEESEEVASIEIVTEPPIVSSDSPPIILNNFLQTGNLLSITQNLLDPQQTSNVPVPSENDARKDVVEREVINGEGSGDKRVTEQSNKSDGDNLELEQEAAVTITTHVTPEQHESTIIEARLDASSITVTEEELSDATNDEVSFSENGSKKEKFGVDLFKCSICMAGFLNSQTFKLHMNKCVKINKTIAIRPYSCIHCNKCFKTVSNLLDHIRVHGKPRFGCSLCDFKHAQQLQMRNHMKTRHNVINGTLFPIDPNKNNVDEDDFVLRPKIIRSLSTDTSTGKDLKTVNTLDDSDLSYGPDDIKLVPIRPIFNHMVKCSLCGYATKVRANIIRHFHIHLTSKEAPIPAAAPVNPVPCLDKNEKMFDKMYNLALSSYNDSIRNTKMEHMKSKLSKEDEASLPLFIPSTRRYTCGANNCDYLCLEESMLRSHLQALHSDENIYKCTHCQEKLSKDKGVINIDQILKHLRLHDLHLYKCHYCKFIHYLKHKVDRHVVEKHGDTAPIVVIIREMDNEPTEAMSQQEEVKELKPWRCGMCKYRCSTKPDIMLHVFNKHDLDSQFKCALCNYRSSLKQVFSNHFEREHLGHAVNVIDAYYEEEVKNVSDSLNFDTTPLWQRERNKIKHIRGIPVDDSNKMNRKSLTKTTNLDVDKTISKKPKTLKEKKMEFLKNIEAEVIEIDDDNEPPLMIKESEEENTNNKLMLERSDSQDIKDDIVSISLQNITEMRLDELTSANLAGTYGPFGKPYNKQYLCPLCNTFKTRKSEDITHHLYKELHYPRFVCTNCGLTGITYSFLQKHSTKKHLGLPASIHPISPDTQIEDWVQKVLAVQNRIIEESDESIVSSTTFQDVSKKPKLASSVTEINAADSSSTSYIINTLKTGHQCPHCQYKCKTPSDLRKHERRHWVCKPLRCGYCDAEGVTTYELHQHSKRAHPTLEPLVITVPTPSTPIIRPIMRKRKYARNDDTITSSSDELSPKAARTEPQMSPSNSICTEENNSSTYVCSYCPEKCNFISEMKYHWELTHKLKGCAFTYTAFTNTKRPPNYKCSYCGFVGPWETMKKHFKSAHPNVTISVYRYKCGCCSKYFRNIDKIRTHYKLFHNGLTEMNFEIDDPPTLKINYACEYCNKDFDEHSQLLDHHNTLHSHLELNLLPEQSKESNLVEKNFKCPLASCSYFSINYALMRDHVRMHAKPFQCDNCSQRFIYPSFVKAHHVKEHQGLDYLCKSSEEGWALYGELKNNILTLNKSGEYEIYITKCRKSRVPKITALVPSPAAIKKLKSVARKSTTQIKAVIRKETARKSTTQVRVPLVTTEDEGFSYYGTKPDLTGAENLRTILSFNDSYLKMNFTRLQGIFDIFPSIVLKDIKADIPEL